MTLVSKLALAIAVSVPVAAQNGTFVSSGTGCPLPTPPTLSIDQPPVIGSTSTVTCSDLPLDTVISVLFVGSNQVNVPLDTLLGAPGCTGYVDGILGSPTMTLTAPTSTTAIAIPNTLALVLRPANLRPLRI